MAVGDIYVGDLHFTLQENPNSYCFYYRLDGESNELVASRDVAVHVKDAIWPLIKPLVSMNFVAKCSVGREVFPQTSIPEVQAIIEPGERTVTPPDGNLPGQCSMVATLFGNQADPDKHNRGRDFWTALMEADQDNGKWDSTALGLYQDFYEQLPKTFLSTNGNSFSWGHFSMTQAKKTVSETPPDPLPAFFWPIELIRLDPRVRTQRRRQPEDPCIEFVMFDPRL